MLKDLLFKNPQHVFYSLVNERNAGLSYPNYIDDDNTVWVMDENMDIWKIRENPDNDKIDFDVVDWEDVPEVFWDCQGYNPDISIFFLSAPDETPTRRPDTWVRTALVEDAINRATTQAKKYFDLYDEETPEKFWIMAKREDAFGLAEVIRRGDDYKWSFIEKECE